MKCGRIITLSIFFLSLFIGSYKNTFAATYLPNTIKAPSNLGLVTYFPLDENSGTNVSDFSGNGNNGTLTNGPTWMTGRLGRAVRFDGADDVIAATTNDIFTENGALTIHAWIQPESIGENSEGHIVDRSASVNGPFLSLSATNRVRFQVDGSTDLVRETSDNAITLNKWQEVMVTWDGSTTASNVHIYINGVEAAYATTQNGSGMVDNSSATFRIGNDSTGARTFLGRIDDVRVYNRVFTTSEVLKLSQSKEVIRKGVTNQNVIAYWPMNENQGTTVGDVSGNGNTGTATNFAAVPTLSSGWSVGRLGKTLNFDGVNDYIALPDSTTLTLTPTTTMAAWIYLRSFPVTGSSFISQIIGDETGVGCDGTGAGAIWRIGSQGSSTFAKRIGINLRSGAGNDNDNQNNTDLVLNRWTHIAVTTDGSNVRFYINGTLDATKTYAITPKASTCTWSIGASTSTTRFFNGKIDDLRLYNRTLSPAEIFALFKQSSVLVNKSQTNIVPNGIVGFWPFDGKYISWGAATTSDASSNGHTGTLTNMTQSIATAIGKTGQALKFDGVNDSVVLADDPAFDLFVLGKFTWSSWVKPSAFGDLIDIWASYDAGANNIFTISAHTTTDPDWGPVTKGITVTWANFITGGQVSVHSNNNVLNTDVWNHVTVTYDGSIGTQGNRFKIYIDGVDQTATGDIFSSGTMGTISPATTQIAGEPGVQFNGAIDEVRFYNRLLSKREIMNLFCNCRDVANE